MLVTAVFVLFTALLASADGSSSHKPVARAAEITDVGASEVKTQAGYGQLSSFGNREFPSSNSSLSKRATYTSCSPEQQKEIVNAIKEAQGYASVAYQHLKSNPKGSLLYTRWFGTFESEVYHKAIGSSSQLRKLPQGWKYQCRSACIDDKRLAWVESGVFNICPAFWKPNSNMKAFTIIQGGTHFEQVLGSYNLVYGYHDSAALAKKNDYGARLNADNHAFFFLGAWGEKLEKDGKKGSRFRLPTKQWFGTRVN